MNAARRSWTQWVSMALVTCLAVFVWEAVSDEPPSADRPHRVAVALLDVAKVFKGHEAFNARIARIKTEIETHEKEVAEKKTGIDSLRPKKDGSGGGSGAAVPEDVIAKLELALQVNVATKRKEFLDREAQAYAETYAAIEQAVAEIADSNDVGLVLRYNSEKIDTTDRASVLQGVNRVVVYSAVPDLTNNVLAKLNGR